MNAVRLLLLSRFKDHRRLSFNFGDKWQAYQLLLEKPETHSLAGGMSTSGTDANQAIEPKKDTNSSRGNDPIVQYIVVRTDLEWGTGALIAQACHASVATIAQTIETAPTKSYLADLVNMHKIVLKADKVEDLIKLECKLKEANVAHHLWMEQPENVPTCLACSPQQKSLIQTIFRHFKLFK